MDKIDRAVNRLINEGTWSLPETDEDVGKLVKIIQDLRAGKMEDFSFYGVGEDLPPGPEDVEVSGPEWFGEILGDDELFDTLDHLTHGPATPERQKKVADAIVARLQELSKEGVKDMGDQERVEKVLELVA